jgi:threonine dehydrogenase-like Zn-dependent dehydrogenase
MKTKAVRLYGKEDLRLEEFELPPMKDDEILAEVISDSLCMSSYKAAMQGADHKRVPNDVADNPTIVGHEFAGRVLEVGDKWKHKFESSIDHGSGRIFFPLFRRKCHTCDHPGGIHGTGLYHPF